MSPFRIAFRGVTASSSCILIQGFPEDGQLKILRNTLRDKFKQSGLEHSIDKRYQLQTAHITAIRFKESFAEAEAFVKAIESLRDTDFGSCLVKQLELVGNDWYHRKRESATHSSIQTVKFCYLDSETSTTTPRLRTTGSE